MTLTDALILASFVVGAIVGNALFWQYLVRSPWRSTATGYVLVALFASIAIGYNLSVAVLIWPEVFQESTAGLWLRISLRFAIDGVLIGLYVLMLRAQRAGRVLAPPPTVETFTPPIEVGTPPGGTRRPTTD